jgi:transmembrane sensor
MVSNMSTMKKRIDAESRSMAEQAAEWLLILEDDRPEDQAAFADWLVQSPLHVKAFLHASAIDALAAEIDPERSIEIPAGPFSDAVDIRSPSDTDLRPVPSPRAKGGWRGGFQVKAWAIAACVALVSIAAAVFFSTHGTSSDVWKHYSAAVGEQRVLELEDGSVMYLGPGSSVDTLFLFNERRLRLVSGEAMFQVRHDKTRPFRVHSGRTVIQAVGTQFSVSQVREDSVVSVVEGVVQVSRDPTIVEKLVAPVGIGSANIKPVRLTAGQQTRVAGDGEVMAPKPASVDPVKSWKERRLTFINESLFAIADEFNRYNRTPKIRVADAAAGELRFAAAFDANDPESLVIVLGMNPKLKVERRDGEIVIQSH